MKPTVQRCLVIVMSLVISLVTVSAGIVGFAAAAGARVHAAQPRRALVVAHPKPKPRPKRSARAKVAARRLPAVAAPAPIDPRIRAPFGSLDVVAADFGGVAVSGWAVDPDTAWPIMIGVVVDFAQRPRIAALGDRADVARAFAGFGPAHGFLFGYALAPGGHFVCVTAINVSAGSDTVLGCRTFTVRSGQPMGAIDGIDAVGAGRRVTGWATDPDGVGPASVSFSDQLIGSVDDPVVTALAASGPAATFGASLPVIGPGSHFVCATIGNHGYGTDQSLGCRILEVVDHRPTGSVDEVRPVSGSALVSGWAADPDSALPVAVDLAVDGVVRRVSADIAGGAHPGFSTTIGGLSAGRHGICATLVDVPATTASGVSGDRRLPCASVVVGGPIEFGTSGLAGDAVPVGPGSDSPIAHIDRDGGVSTTLRDGSVLWLFGDSAERGVGGALKYFVSGTGALAPAATPTATGDAVDENGHPFALAPEAGDLPCEAGSSPAMWPLSAVTVPDGIRDRVIVYLADLCLNATTSRLRGVAVAEWFHDPTAPVAGTTVQLRLVTRSLGADRRYGSAAVFDADAGYVDVYDCGLPSDLGLFDQYGPCRVARVLPATVGDVSTYTYWDGTTWVADPTAAVGMDLPAGASPAVGFPVSGFTVTFDPTHGVYVMAYMPWPGYTDRILIRVSRGSTGPWTEPLEVRLPGCSNTVRGAGAFCYAGTAQPSMSRPGELGIGFYDQAALRDETQFGGPVRGSYMVVRVPFTIG